MLNVNSHSPSITPSSVPGLPPGEFGGAQAAAPQSGILAGRQVAAEAGGPSRIPGDAAPERAALPERSVASAPPIPTRASSAVKRANAKYSLELQSVYKDMGNKRLAPARLAEKLLYLGRSEQKLQGHGGESFKALNTMMANLSETELRSLVATLRSDRVAAAQSSLQRLGTNDAALGERALIRLERAAVAALADGAAKKVSAAVETHVGNAREALRTGNSATLTASMRTAFSEAADALGSLQRSGVSTMDDSDVLTEVGSAVLEQLKSCTRQEIADLLRHTPSGHLHTLFAMADHSMSSHVEEAIAMQTDVLASDVARKMALLAKAPAVPGSFVSPQGDMLPAAQALARAKDAMDSHLATHEKQARADVTQARQMIAATLRDVDLGRLDEAALAGLARFAASVDMPIKDTALHGQAAARLGAEENIFKGALQNVLGSLEQGDTPAILQHACEMEASSRRLTDLHVVLGTPTSRAELTSSLNDGVLDAMNPSALPSLQHALRGPQVETLISALCTAADSMVSADQTPARLTMVASTLENLERQVSARARAMGEPSTGASSAQARPPAAPFSADVRNALLDQFGVSLPLDSATHVRGVFGEEARRALAEKIEAAPSEHERAGKIQPSGVLVTDQFFADANRFADFRLPDGLPLIDYRGWTDLDDAGKYQRIDAGMRSLVALFDGDTAKASAAIIMANQTVVAGFTAAFGAAMMAAMDKNEPQPFSLPDGRGGAPGLGGKEGSQHPVYQFQRGANGRPVLDLQFNVKGGTMMLIDGVAKLDPQKSVLIARARVEVVEDDGRLALRGQPTYEADLVADPFKRDYDRPTAASIFAVDGGDPTEVVQDLMTYTKDTPLHALAVAVGVLNNYHHNPGAQSAERALEQLRLSDDPGVRAACAAIETEILPLLQEAGPALVAAFDTAMEKTYAMVSENYLQSPARREIPWPDKFEPPIRYEIMERSGNDAAVDALLKYMQDETRSPEISALILGRRAIETKPSMLSANRLYEERLKQEDAVGAFSDAASGPIKVNIDSGSILPVRERLNSIERDLDARFRVDLFDGVKDILKPLLGPEVASMAAAIESGRMQ